MGKFAVAVALATTVLTGAAQARDNSWYIGLEAGGFNAETRGWDLKTPAGVGKTDAARINYEPGWEVGGVLGYDFGAFRSEFEVAYKNANLSSVTLAGGLPAFPGPGGNVVRPGGRFDSADGNARILTFMLNGMFDFGAEEGSPFGGFVGGGVGIGRFQSHIWQLEKFNGPAFSDDSDTGFAWQAIAGIRYALSEKVDLSLKYRFFNMNGIGLQTTNGNDLSGDWRSHSLLLGISFSELWYSPRKYQ